VSGPVGDVQVDQISECGGILGLAMNGGLAQFDALFGRECPFFDVLVPPESFADIGAIAADLDVPIADRSRLKVATSCALCVRWKVKNERIWENPDLRRRAYDGRTSE
jgi:hypothetical protein